MPVVTDPEQTRDLLDEMRQADAALPCFCTENSWTTEAILRATQQVGEELDVKAPPVSVAFTGAYHRRSNLRNWWLAEDMQTGFRSVTDEIRVLASEDGPYASCRVFPHLDHGDPDGDQWLMEEHADEFAMIMYDGGELSFEENVQRTKNYVESFGDRVVVEGAVAALKEASEDVEAFGLTTAGQAREFLERTGCDLIVPNVGTEHRASEAGVARYHPERAQEVAEAAGPVLVLHGTSSLADDELARLPGDGIVKVNVWTVIERKGAEAMARYLLENAADMVPASALKELADAGLFPHDRVPRSNHPGPQVTHFPLVEWRKRWTDQVASTLVNIFKSLGYANLAG